MAVPRILLLSVPRMIPFRVPAVFSRGVKIYTKTGDAGTTSLFSLERRSKADPHFAALGDTDELNAQIGVVVEQIRASAHHQQLAHLVADLQTIQSRLFDVGSHLATPLKSSSPNRIARAVFAETNVADLETLIDAMEEKLPPILNFVIPSGGLVCASLHVARAVCRRAERSTVPLVNEQQVEPVVMRYLNRLSDFLFVLARYACHVQGEQETLYKKPRVAQ